MADGRAEPQTGQAPVLELTGIRFGWRPGGPPLLSVGHLAVGRGERVLVRGPSGSGKTTLLGLMAGVSRPDRGEVRLLGAPFSAAPAARRDRLRADHVGYVFQLFNLVPYLTARENILLALRFSKRRAARLAEMGRQGRAEAERLAAGLGLPPDLLDRHPRALSVGQQQRVASARALIGAPELILADEPTSALDEEVRGRFLDLLFAECAGSGTAAVVVSHDRDLVPYFGRVVEIADLQAEDRRAPVEPA
ncbi:MAG: ABC transporter ATP-binding protein [Alphaproteobacteria bacterium]|nr:ABC transporter ATP-binding protein [Alphaproteobacteria bacterium]